MDKEIKMTQEEKRREAIRLICVRMDKSMVGVTFTFDVKAWGKKAK
jgi:hypothetical protein